MARTGNNHKGGRPRGKKAKKTLERELIAERYRQRVMHNADLLFDSQFSIARGIQFLYKIEKEWVKLGKGKENGYWRPKKPELVEDVIEIESYLEGLIEDGDPNDKEDSAATYYFITTKEPSNSALDSLLNRALGKVSDKVEHTGKDGSAIKVEGVEIILKK